LATKTRGDGGGKAKGEATKRRGATPRIRASHASVEGGPRPARARSVSPQLKQGKPSPKKALAGPKRAKDRRSMPPPAAPEPSTKARELAVALAAEGIEKKALGIEILDVAGKVDYTDFLVLMTGRSDRHVSSLAQGIEEALRTKRNKRPVAVEGMQNARWVLMDFGDVVVHVFQEEVRSLYDLEGLWMDAHRLPLPAGVQEER